MLTRKQKARARNMVKRAKRIAHCAERTEAKDFAEVAALYRKADRMFFRAYGWLRFST